MGWFHRRKKVSESTTGVSLGSGSALSVLTTQHDYKALENSAFWACIRQLCMAYATMPLHLYRPNGNGWTEIYDSRIAMLMEHPNYYQTGYEFRWSMGFNYELFGVAYAIIERDIQGRIVALYPVSPRNISRVVLADGTLGYCYGPTGQLLGERDILKVSHTPIGYREYLAPLFYADRDVEIASANKQLQKSFFDKGTSLGGVVTVPKGTKKEVKEEISRAIQAGYSGSANAFKTMVIEDSMKYEAFRFSEGDTKNLIDAQGWSVKEVARRFGVPAFWIGDTSNSTVGNSEQQSMTLVTTGLQPRFISWEKALLKIVERPGDRFRFNLRGLMRGDHVTRASFYHNALMDGWMSINEVRALEDLNPIEGGDQHFFPMNYTTIDKVGQTTNNGWDLNAASHDNSKKLDDKVLRDRAFYRDVTTVTKSSRSKIEAIIRKDMKEAIDWLNEHKDMAADDIISAFKTWAGGKAAEWGESYAEVYKQIMARLYPIVQKQVGTDQQVDKDSMEAFASKCGMDAAGRCVSNRVRQVASKLTGASQDDIESDIDELDEHWTQDVPAQESGDETHRAGQAFDVFLYQQLGVQYMHVVASPDACEFCGQVDGKVTSVDGNVIAKGTDLTDPQGNVMHIHRDLAHPPWHTGCRCVVAPGK